MADIFVSYKREDRAAAERLAQSLEQLGFDVWWDFELISGDQYRNVIRAVIDQCSAAIVLWSKRAIESDFVMDEATYAKAKSKLCPVRIENVDLPFGFGQTHTCDLSDWDGSSGHAGFEALIRAVEGRVGRKAVRQNDPDSAHAQTMIEESRAFQRAQLAQTVSALRDFLGEFPSSTLSEVVRQQLGTTAAKTTVPRTTDHAQGPRHDARASKSRRSWLVAAGAGVVAIAITLLAIGIPMLTISPDVGGHEREDRPEVSQLDAAQPGATQQSAGHMEENGAVVGDVSAPERQASSPPSQISALETPAPRPDTNVADAGSPAVTPNRQVAWAPFAADQLGQELRDVALSARRDAAAADAVAEEARAHAARARQAAERARSGQRGTRVHRYNANVVYAGEWNEIRTGYGVTTSTAYRDEALYSSGVPFGVITFTAGPLARAEGNYRFGVITFRNGTVVRGGGSGEIRYPDGTRFEGHLAISRGAAEGDAAEILERFGPGILWSADGAVLQAGRWGNGRVTPIP